MPRHRPDTKVLLDKGGFGKVLLQITNITKKDGENHYKCVVLDSNQAGIESDTIKYFNCNQYDQHLNPTDKSQL